MSERDDNQEPGRSLREAREASGLSAKEVADSLNLLASNIEALEANDYSHMNADIFIRGYVKSYARYLGLDPEPLLAAAERRLNRNRDSSSATNATGDLAERCARKGGLSAAQKVGIALIVAAALWLASNYLMTGGDKARGAQLLPCEHPAFAGRALGNCDLENA